MLAWMARVVRRDYLISLNIGATATPAEVAEALSSNGCQLDDFPVSDVIGCKFKWFKDKSPKRGKIGNVRPSADRAFLDFFDREGQLIFSLAARRSSWTSEVKLLRVWPYEGGECIVYT